jgi:hypothetical protein
MNNPEGFRMRIQRRRETVPYADPLHAGRHPFQSFLLALCVVSGIPLLLGAPPAASATALLPSWVVTAWGASLALGAGVAIAGSYWPKRNYATALTVERIGLVIVGPAALLYAAIITIYTGAAGAVPASIVTGFGVASLIRAHDLGKIIRRAIAGDSSLPVLREGDSC